MKYYSAIKRNEDMILIHSAILMNFEKVQQAKHNMFYIPFLPNIQNSQIHRDKTEVAVFLEFSCFSIMQFNLWSLCLF